MSRKDRVVGTLVLHRLPTDAITGQRVIRDIHPFFLRFVSFRKSHRFRDSVTPSLFIPLYAHAMQALEVEEMTPKVRDRS